MNPIELQNAFEIELNRRDSSLTLSSDKVFYFINRASEEFVKERFTNRVERTQKEIDDLVTLIRSADITPTLNADPADKPNSYSALIPSDYLFTLDEEVDIDIDGTSKRVGITECTSDTYRSHIDDSYSEHKLKYGSAKPLRLYEKTDVEIITDGNYTVDKYYMRYIKEPNKVDLNAYIADNANGLLDLPDYTHPEIVKRAVRMAVENLVEPRYQTVEREINKLD